MVSNSELSVMVDHSSRNLPSKPEFLDWLENMLPFKLPRIPLPRVAKNFDKAAARLVTSGLANLSQRLDASSNRIRARSNADVLIARAERHLSDPGPLDSTLEDRALHHALGKAVDAQQNRERILELTVDEISKKGSKLGGIDASEEIDNDWLNAFARHAENKSNEDVQQIWAKILASEIRNPGSTSLRTLDFLASITSKEARRVVTAFSFVIDSLMIPKFVQEKEIIPYTDLLFIQEIGIMTGAFGLGGPGLTLKSLQLDTFVSAVQYFGKIGIFTGSDPLLQLKTHVFPLTEVGREIFAITDTVAPNYDFFEEFCTSFSGQGLDEISIADFLARNEAGLHYVNKRVLFKKDSS